jgi:hypothetical protein
MSQSSLKKWFVFVVTILLVLSVSEAGTPAGPSPVVATVQKVNGTATVFRQGQTTPAKIGSEIREYDTLSTGPDGSIGVVFSDDTLLSLGPESVLVIDEFVFAPKEGEFSLTLRMVKGTAAYISGLLSKLSPGSARFQTPAASIGIRGTKFVVKVTGE